MPALTSSVRRVHGFLMVSLKIQGKKHQIPWFINIRLRVSKLKFKGKCLLFRSAHMSNLFDSVGQQVSTRGLRVEYPTFLDAAGLVFSHA